MSCSSQFWDKYIISKQKLILKLIRNRCSDKLELKEELLSHIHEKLFENDRRRLKLYDKTKGASVLTYFCTVVNRLISSYFQIHYGRFRPPKWLLDQNDFLMLMIYKHLCFERMPEDELLEYLKNNAPGKRKQSSIEKRINIVLQKFPNCGKVDQNPLCVEKMQISSGEDTQEEKLMVSHWADIFKVIFSPKDTDQAKIYDDALYHSEIEQIKEKFTQYFQISPEKRLFLRMIYQDGMTITAAGKQVGWNKNQSTSHHRRLLAKLRSILEEHFKKTVS